MKMTTNHTSVYAKIHAFDFTAAISKIVLLVIS